jgi:imidazolonepropionase-like amidohydrolase
MVTMEGRAPRRGRALAELKVIRDGALLVRDGTIAALGPAAKVE